MLVHLCVCVRIMMTECVRVFSPSLPREEPPRRRWCSVDFFSVAFVTMESEEFYTYIYVLYCVCECVCCLDAARHDIKAEKWWWGGWFSG